MNSGIYITSGAWLAVTLLAGHAVAQAARHDSSSPPTAGGLSAAATQAGGQSDRLAGSGVGVTDEVLPGDRRVTPLRAVVDLDQFASHGTGASGPRPARPLASPQTWGPDDAGPAASFLAYRQTEGEDSRADGHGAVSPNHLMAVVNGAVVIQDRLGTVLRQVSLTDFWAAVGPFTNAPLACLTNPNYSPVFTPRVLYDHNQGRWITVALADGGFAATSSLLIGVSTTDDPAKDWRLFRVYADATRRHTFEFPSVGQYLDRIVVQVGVNTGYVWGSTTSAGSHIFVFSKADLFERGEARYTLFQRADLDYTQTPIIDAGWGQRLGRSSSFRLVGLAGSGDTRNGLRLYTISGEVGAEVFGIGPTVTSPRSWRNIPSGGFNANTLPQNGTNRKLAPLDSVVLSAAETHDGIWVTHHVQLPANAPNRSAVQWWQIDRRGRVLQRGLLDDPSGAEHFAYPSLGVNSYGDALLGASKFTSNQFPSAIIAMRLGSDPVNTFRPPVLLKSGEAPFVWEDPCAGNRIPWGFYSASMWDPRLEDSGGGRDFWTLQPFAATPTNGRDRWGVWWGSVKGLNEPVLEPVSAARRVWSWEMPGFQISIGNVGADPIAGVILTNQLPRGARLAEAPLFAGKPWVDGQEQSETLILPLGTIHPGEFFTFSLTATNLPPGLHTNVFTVSSASGGIPQTAQAVITVLLDADGDELPDDWEAAHGLDSTDPADARADSDGDGLTNRQENTAGTNPRDAQSVLAITDVRHVASGSTPGWRVTFRTVRGRFYQLQRFTELSTGDVGDWGVVADEIYANGTSVAVTDPSGVDAARRYYRVLLLE